MKPRVLEHDRVGDGEPPLVLLPGGLSGWAAWKPLLPALAAERSVVTMQPISNAEGLAGRPGDPSYDAATERASIALTLAAAGVGEMHLIGWSNGGRLALDYALADPEGILSLTLVEPGAHWLVLDADESARSFHAAVAGLEGEEISDEDLCRFLVGAGLGSADTDFKALPQWELWSSCRGALSWAGEGVFASAAAGIEGYERLEIPTLVIRGSTSSPWLRRVAALLARELPDGELVELEGGHACVLESPEGFVAALSAHVNATRS